MGFRSQSGGRRGAGEKFQRSAHEKAKPKVVRKKPDIKYAGEGEAPTLEQVVEKTLTSLERLGSQKFALSPFSQYYDDWLVNLRQVISEFESSPVVDADDNFVKERTRFFVEVESELAKLRIKETDLEAAAKSLSDNNHFLVELDVVYAGQTRELGMKRNAETADLSKTVHDLEAERDKIRRMKTSFFGFTKGAQKKKEAEISRKLVAAQTELELELQGFNVEQDKLHDAYEKKKQETIEKIRDLEVTIANIESDGSESARQTSTVGMADAVKALLARKAATPKDTVPTA